MTKKKQLLAPHPDADRDPKLAPRHPKGAKQRVLENHPQRHKQRFEKLPPGFIHYRGKGCPFPERARVDVVILTDQGYGIDGPVMAMMHDWGLPVGEVGSIAGYRLVGPPKAEVVRPVP